jgi:triosephosphate isomerase
LVVSIVHADYSSDDSLAGIIEICPREIKTRCLPFAGALQSRDHKEETMRTCFVAANWKMHKTIGETRAFLSEFLPHVQGIRGVEIAIAPPFTALAAVGTLLEGTSVALTAQNMHHEPQGAYTGEISPLMLRDVGCRYVIVGHSERRRHFHEDDAFTNRKVVAAFEHGLVPILCVGETLEERRAGRTNAVLERQLTSALQGLSRERIERLVIAYEPVWAIGTGETASPEDAEAGARFLRSLLAGLYDEETAASVRVQYGGSVKPENARELMALPDVDGALVGGASLDPETFAGIVKEAAKAVSVAGSDADR